MQFTKLRLLGFKSFVDPTELTIATGLTGVVGPNGCGKSNLLEALRWVMGENRPKAMRGGGMEDVIFAGAATRPARNYAEVMLSIDNSDFTAPVAFNDSEQLNIVRRITRDIGSAYKTNGKEVRARDVQMLFADASTGAHSPSLVRQGQISELINANPKARRRVLEEAAGISGLYQRRHEASLKLKGTETNLARVDDVLEQLESQLNGLARQAKQAARYREVGTELREAEGQLLYLRWHVSEIEKMATEQAAREVDILVSQAQIKVNTAHKASEKLDDQLPPAREDSAVAAAILQRLSIALDAIETRKQNAIEAISGLQARIDQIAKDIERESHLNRDAQETIEKLEWERKALDKASIGHDEKLNLAQTSAQASSDGLKEFELDLDKNNEDLARLSARHQTLLRRSEDATKSLEKSRVRVEQVKCDTNELNSKLSTSSQLVLDHKQDWEEKQQLVSKAESALSQSEDTRATAQDVESVARGKLSEIEGEASTLRAELSALNRLFDREDADEGQILDVLDVQAGFEAAIGAALADDLRAPLVNQDGASGWRLLTGSFSDAELPTGTQALNSYVQAPDVLDRRLAQIAVVSREDGARLQNSLKAGQRLVSKEGDLWRWDGYSIAADEAPSAAGLRLMQINRQKELQISNDVLSKELVAAKLAHDGARGKLNGANSEEQRARIARKSAEDAMNQSMRNLSKAEADHQLLLSKLESAELAYTHREEELNAAQGLLDEASKATVGLENIDDLRDKVEQLKIGVEAARVGMISKRTIFDELRRDGEARVKRSQEIHQQLSGWRLRLGTASDRTSELEKRKEKYAIDLKIAMAEPDAIALEQEKLKDELDKAKVRQSAAQDVLAVLETDFRQAEKEVRDQEHGLSDLREKNARTRAFVEAALDRSKATEHRIFEETEKSPQDLLAGLSLDLEALPAVEIIEVNVEKYRRQRDALGAVNLRAEEDAKEIREEFDALDQEKTDLEEAVRKLRLGINSLNREGRERLLTAFDEVNKNFNMLFKHLFGGGDANLVLVESDDPLEAGLEIMCQPPGKKLSALSLLSGGEQTLTALSLIFAVFLANPSPICVLDEVDAPLDDANVNRFCDLLDEMTRRTNTRFLIITHHAVTMSRMERLYGVTMSEQGVSQLVSVDLKKAEEMVDA